MKAKPSLAMKPVGLVAGIGAGLLVGWVFRKTWRAATGDEAPDATDSERGWVEVLVAAGLQAAALALVKAAVDRAVAIGIRKGC